MRHRPVSRPALFLLVFLLGGIVSACQSTPERKLEKDGFTLIYRDRSSAGAEVEKMTLDHPLIISEEAMTNHLLSLRYEESSLLGKKRYVFSTRDMNEFSTFLTKALNHASPKNIVHFMVQSVKGTIEGDVFASGGKLHWRFQSIQGLDFSSSSFPGYRGAPWRLLPKKGQQFHVTPKLLGDRTQENWLLADLILPEKAKRLTKGIPTAHTPAPPAQTSERATLEKKLKALKQFHEKGLIDERDYQRKKKELLDGLL